VYHVSWASILSKR